MKLKQILEESIKEKLTEEQISEFKELVTNYNKYAPYIYKEKPDVDIVDDFDKIKNMFSSVLMQEAEDWLDNITINRHSKSLSESVGIFQKTMKEMNIMQHRLEAAYEDVGSQLSKYYEIVDLEEGNAFGAAVTKAKKQGKKSFKVGGKTYPVKK